MKKDMLRSVINVWVFSKHNLGNDNVILKYFDIGYNLSSPQRHKIST